MGGSKWSARATKNSVITPPTAKSELIFEFSDIVIGGGGVLGYPPTPPDRRSAVPTQGRPESGRCSFSEVSGGEKKDGRAKTQKFVVVYTPGMQ